jgi:hypothetical protein
MTRDQYFEMCEALGSEPIDSEIPIEFDDLPTEIQEALRIYRYLQDNWDYMSGKYIGKNLTGIKDIFEMFDVATDERKYMFQTILEIDRIRAEAIKNAKPNK